MAFMKVFIGTGRPKEYVISNFQKVGGSGQNFLSGDHSKANRFIQYITSLASGTEGYYPIEPTPIPPVIQFNCVDSMTEASGTLTFVSAVAANTFSLNGVTFTGVASGATGNQFNIGVSDTATAANAASAINSSGSAAVSDYVRAESALGVVTITPSFPGNGIWGNLYPIAGGTNITASGSTLAGGAEDPNSTTISF